MIKVNDNYAKLKESYLFYRIGQKVKAYKEAHPGEAVCRLGIGDVSLPLCDAAIKALHGAADDQGSAERFQGYTPEPGMPFFREAVAGYYASRGISLQTAEVFVSSGASDELGDILDLFSRESAACIMEPAYPAYLDANIMAGRRITTLSAGPENGFLPTPEENPDADLIYLCSPNNPTGVILFDAAYEAFIEDDSLPHSIFEIEGARTCAIEICSLSKTAGFTGTRLGYTVIPLDLERGGMNLNAMWVRNRTTKTNGVSCILQRGGAAVFTPEGQRQVMENIHYYKRNARVITEALAEAGTEYWGGENAPYVWMRCPEGMKSWDFFDRMLREIQVIGTPGEGFGPCGEGYFRLSAFGRAEETAEAARRMKEWLKGMLEQRGEGK